MDSYRSRQCSEILKCSQKSELVATFGTRAERHKLQERTPSDVDDKFFEIKKLFELRVNNLQSSIREVFDSVLYDPIIQTLRKERNDESLIQQRVSEILTNIVTSEKEVCIEKLSKQFSFLKSENAKLKEAIEKLEEKNNHAEIEKSLREVQTELKKEVRNKLQLEEEVITLQRKTKELELKYDESVNRRDSQLNSYREADRKEIHFLREQIRDLEADLTSKNQLVDTKNRELESHIKDSTLQNQRIAELEKELRVIKKEANEYKTLSEKIEATNQNLRHNGKEMNETIKSLQTSLNQAEEKLYKNYEKIQKEQDSFREDISSIESRYKEKVLRYKEKNKDYKKRYIDAEAALSQLKSAAYEEENTRLETFSEKPTHRGDTKSESEPLNAVIDRIRWDKEEKRTYEKQARDLEFELNHIKDNSSRQIAEFHARVQELELLLNERDKYINSEYVTITYHEMKMREKQLLIDKLKEELSTLEQTSKLETARITRSNNRELQDYEEFVKKQLTLLEQEVESVSNARNAAEECLAREKSKVQELENSINEHELEQKKMMQYIADIEQANEQLKNVCDEHNDANAELKQKLDSITKGKQRSEVELGEAREQFEAKVKQIEALKFNLEQTNRLQSEQKDQILQLYRNIDNLREDHEAKMVQKAQEFVKFEEVIQELEKILELKLQELEKEKLSRDNCQFKLLSVEKDLETKTSEANELRQQIKRQKLEQKSIISGLLWKCEGLKRQINEIMTIVKKDIVNIQSSFEMSITNLKSFTLGLLYAKKQGEQKENQLLLPMAQGIKDSLVSEKSREPLRLLENTQNLPSLRNAREDNEELSRLIKKNIELERLLEKTKTHYIADISILKKEIIGMQELAVRDREELETHYEGQIENCKKELHSVKEELTNIRSEYEEQMKKLDAEHDEEVQCLQTKYTAVLQELNSHKIRIEKTELDNSGRVGQLIDRIDELEFENTRLVREKQSIHIKLDETKRKADELKTRADELEQLLLFERRKTQNTQRENLAELRSLKQINQGFENDISHANERFTAVIKERLQNQEGSEKFQSRSNRVNESKNRQHPTITPKKTPQESLVTSAEGYKTSKDAPAKRDSYRGQTTQRRHLASTTQASRSNSTDKDAIRRLETDYSEGSPRRRRENLREELHTFKKRDSHKGKELRPFFDSKNKIEEFSERSEY